MCISLKKVLSDFMLFSKAHKNRQKPIAKDVLPILKL